MKTILISDIELDAELQPRAKLDDATVAEYAEDMKAGEKFPPVGVVKDGKQFWLYDGYHRVLAAQRNGEKKICAEILMGDRAKALWLSLGANKTHGLRRTNADKERAVRKALEAEPEKSDRQIAEHVGVSDRMVAAHRAELEAGAKLSHLNERIGKDKKTYPAHPKPTVTSSSDETGQARTGTDDEGEDEKVPMGEEPAEYVPEPVTDAVGNPISGNIQAAFGRRNGLTILAGEASHLKSRIRDAAGNDDELFADVNLTQVEADLDNVARALRAARPYALCPYCAGDGCQVCRTRGWIGEITYDAAPEEMKLGGLIADVKRLEDELAMKHSSGYSAVGAVQDKLGIRGIKPLQVGRDRLIVYRDRLIDVIGKLT